jgi:hypothetical protein
MPPFEAAPTLERYNADVSRLEAQLLFRSAGSGLKTSE